MKYDLFQVSPFTMCSIPIWPSSMHHTMLRDVCQRKISQVCQVHPCVEFRVETASSLVLHKLFYSVNKSRTTVKCLVGICPVGVYFFISTVFPGSVSDKDITVKSGLHLILPGIQGEGLMADREDLH